MWLECSLYHWFVWFIHVFGIRLIQFFKLSSCSWLGVCFRYCSFNENFSTSLFFSRSSFGVCEGLFGLAQIHACHIALIAPTAFINTDQWNEVKRLHLVRWCDQLQCSHTIAQQNSFLSIWERDKQSGKSWTTVYADVSRTHFVFLLMTSSLFWFC